VWSFLGVSVSCANACQYFFAQLWEHPFVKRDKLLVWDEKILCFFFRPTLSPSPPLTPPPSASSSRHLNQWNLKAQLGHAVCVFWNYCFLLHFQTHFSSDLRHFFKKQIPSCSSNKVEQHYKRKKIENFRQMSEKIWLKFEKNSFHWISKIHIFSDVWTFGLLYYEIPKTREKVIWKHDKNLLNGFENISVFWRFTELKSAFEQNLAI